MDWITLIISSACTILTTVGGCGLLYYKVNKRLKEAEVKGVEADSDSKYMDMWEKALDRSENYVLEKTAEINKLSEKLDVYVNENRKLELLIQELQWFRCEINNCPKRKPPRNYIQEEDKTNETDA